MRAKRAVKAYVPFLALICSISILLLILSGCVNEAKQREEAFKSSIEKSILNRMENSESNDKLKLVNTELAYLEEYREETFSDEKLNDIKNRYLEGLDKQKAAIDAIAKCDQQVAWQEGYVYRCEALKTLYDNYGFLKDNPEFIGTYVSSYDKEKALLDAYNNIESDISSQDTPLDWKCDDGHNIYVVMKNNTDHQFSSVWEFSFKDAGGAIAETTTISTENVKPHSTYTVKTYISNIENADGGFDWSNYYYDVKP